jgi:hypothetical protein
MHNPVEIKKSVEFTKILGVFQIGENAVIIFEYCYWICTIKFFDFILFEFKFLYRALDDCLKSQPFGNSD